MSKIELEGLYVIHLETEAGEMPLKVSIGGTGPAGLQGAPGDQGLPGTDGADGNDGAPGTDGVDGNDGAPGTNGVDGNDGAPGTDGVDGNDGAPGTNGVDGNDGAPGTNGVDGNDGAPGSDGVGLPIGGTTGQLASKKSNTDHDVEWVDPPTDGGGDGLTEMQLIQAINDMRLSGKYFTSRTGGYYATQNVSLTNGHIRIAPFIVPEDTVIDNLGTEVMTTATDAEIKLIITDVSDDLSTFNILAETGWIACDATGAIAETLTAAVTLQAGKLYSVGFAGRAPSGAPKIACLRAGAAISMGHSDPKKEPTVIWDWKNTLDVSGASLISPMLNPTVDDTYPPAVYMRVQ